MPQFTKDNNYRTQVKAEKEEYDKMVEEEAIKTKDSIEKRESLVPINAVSQKAVVKLFHDYYPAEVISHLTIDPEKAEALSIALRTLSKNFIKVSGPLTCLGPKCYSCDRCALQKAGVAPISHPCAIELLLIDQWESDYFDDLGVDKQSKVEVDMVRDMVESDLIDWRASHELARGGLFDWNAVGMSDDGKPIYRKEEAIAIGIKLKFKARKDRIREDLMATRKMRAKFGLAKSIDPSKFAATLQERYNAIKTVEVIDENDIEEMTDNNEE